MTEINKDYLSRLYALHKGIAAEINLLVKSLQDGASFEHPYYFNSMRWLSSELETVFSEVLSEEERREIESSGSPTCVSRFSGH